MKVQNIEGFCEHNRQVKCLRCWLLEKRVCSSCNSPYRELPDGTIVCECSVEEGICPECGSLLREQREIRNWGWHEMVSYCDGCGFTATSA